ncbi:MAG: glycosyltransferase family 25 protein, partial [Pseudomonadota bacterium]|nr:glycosyltransferase family 25 protein [Pseudomonadota bacterium]
MGAPLRALAQGDLVAAAEAAAWAMIPVYVINLARSADRRAFMRDALARAGVGGEFVAAVDGRRCRARGPRALSAAETALILSHRKVWRRLLRGAADFAVVLEDDAHLGHDFAALLAADWGAHSFDAVKLETLFHRVWLTRRGAAQGARALHRLGSEHFGTAGYLVSRNGARKMLALTRGLDQPVDHALFGRETIAARRLAVLQLVPAAVVQYNVHPDPAARRELATTLHESDRAKLAEAARRAKPRGWARLAREARRLVA